MNFNKYGRTAQLFDYQTMSDGLVGGVLNSDGTITINAASSSWAITKYIPVAGREFTLQRQASGGSTSICLYDSNQTYITGLAYNGNGTVTVSANTDVSYIRFTYYRTENIDNIMLNEGSTAKPYEPYGNTWTDIPHYIHNTSTDTLTTLPADIYADGTNATVGLKGNMYQASGVSPTNPIQPQECGDLETEGAKAGQYKIPISSANTTTPVYLGEVESTRWIKKYICTGDETVDKIDNNIYYLSGALINDAPILGASAICTHYESNPVVSGISANLLNGQFTINQVGSGNYSITIHDDINGGNVSARYKQYLAQQYANGTPVTVWYVLANPTTGIVDEPIRKIGDYADEVSGITIPTIAGADSFDVLTTLKPSEVSLSYTGWHDATVQEWDGSQWNQ